MKSHNRAGVQTCLLVVGLALHMSASAAQDNDSSDADQAKLEFKLTPSYYQASDGNDAADLNLRGSIGAHTGWLGQYRDRAGLSQARTGYEYRQDSGLVRVVWSAQLASGGFAGGSATAEIGSDTYGIIGWGRTNLRDYYNLNFDPNDAITVGIGSRAVPRTELTLLHIRDDRLNTHQRVTHFVVRYKFPDSQRLTIDTSYKSGLSSSDRFVRGYAFSLTYDYHAVFARIARDQYANFGDATLTRYSLGMRF